MANNKDFFTVSELAKILGITRGAVHKKIKGGKIETIRIGKFYFVPKSAIKGLATGVLTDKIKAEIDKGVAKAVKEYGKTLKLLGKE